MKSLCQNVMKFDYKAESRRLREDGYSISEIAKLVGSAKSSVSFWVRDIRLSKEQIAVLNARATKIRAKKTRDRPW